MGGLNRSLETTVRLRIRRPTVRVGRAQLIGEALPVGLLTRDKKTVRIALH